MFKRCKVVMLSTNEKSSISFVFNTAYKKILSFKDSFSDNITFGEYVHLYILSDDKIKEGDWCYDEYLDDIFQANRILGIQTRNTSKKIIATTNNSLKLNLVKVNSGSDFILEEISKNTPYLPSPSQSFIEKYITEYNKGNVITDVLVEYDAYHGINTSIAEINAISGDDSMNWKGRGDYCDFKLKINSKDNTITIKKVKDSWSREEVESLLLKVMNLGMSTRQDQLRGYSSNKSGEEILEEWIKQNL